MRDHGAGQARAAALKARAQKPGLTAKPRLLAKLEPTAKRKLEPPAKLKPTAKPAKPAKPTAKAKLTAKPTAKPAKLPAEPEPPALPRAALQAARERLLAKPAHALAVAPGLCRAAALPRDAFVRLFYHSVLPALLRKRQRSTLLLQLTRSARGVGESWSQEETPFEATDSRRDVSAAEARALLEAEPERYALRVVVEARSSAHALLVLRRGPCAWLLDPNGDLGLVRQYFGSEEPLLQRLREALPCELVVARHPPLHHPQLTACALEFCRGGACTFVTGALALRDEEPERLVADLAAGGPRPARVLREVDELLALTLACHLLAEPPGRAHAAARRQALQL